MPDISKITLPSGTTYNIKDEVARQAVAKMNSFEYLICTSEANTPAGVTWKVSTNNSITGTLAPSAATTNKIYLVPTVRGEKSIYDEYLTVKTGDTSYVWELFGDTDVHLADLGSLAMKNNARGSYTPAGAVSQPTFTGSSGNVSVSGTPSGSISVGSGTTNYTPAGTLTGGAIGVTLSTSTKYVAESATGGGSVTAGTAASCTLPSLSMSVSNETLSLSWSAGSFTANRPTVVTLPSFKQATVASGVSSASITTQPTFKGTDVELKFTGKALTSTGTYKPAGTVSKPSFTGSASTITVS